MCRIKSAADEDLALVERKMEVVSVRRAHAERGEHETRNR
jgi:hypothetical protein